MLPDGLKSKDGSSESGGRTRWRKPRKAAGGLSRRHVIHRFRPGDYNQGFEPLESRRLLSSDLTQDIINQLDGGTTTGSVTFNDVTLGSFLSSNSVTVSFQNISQSGSDWTGTISVSAASASLAIGSAVSAQINGESGNPGITGSYTLADQPAGQGAYQLSASQFDLTLSNLLTAEASDIKIDYSPTAAPGQELAQIGSFSASLLPFDNATATVDNLDIFDNGFTLGDGTVTGSPITLGNILSIDQPSLMLSGVGYRGGAFTGTIKLSASSTSLFPGQSDFTATADSPSGTYNIASQTLALSASSFDLKAGNIFEATSTPTATNTPALTFTLDDSQSPPAVTFDAENLTLKSADFPNATGTLTDLHADNTGFTVGSATLAYMGDATLGKILDLTNPSINVNDFVYKIGSGGAITVGGTIGVSADSVSMFPGQTSFTTTVGGLNASYDIDSQVFGLSATSFDLKAGNIFEATSEPTADNTPVLSFTLDDSQSPAAVTFDAQNLTLKSSDFPNATGTLTDLHADNTGFTIGSATLAYTGDATLGKIIDLTNPSINVDNFVYKVESDGAITVGGTVGVSADSVSMFPGQTSFTTTVGGLNASYDIDSQVFGLSATSFDLKAGNIFEATSTPTADNTPVLSFTLDDSQSPAAVTFDAQNLTLKSSDFPNATGTLTDLHADNTGFTIGSATLAYTGDATLGKIIDLTNPSINVDNFVYKVESDGAITVGGTVGVSADSVSMFPGQTSFTTTVGGLNASYDIDSQVFGLSATSFDLKAGNIFEATSTPTADNTPVLSFTLDDSQSPPAVTFDAQNLTLKSADFPKATGTLTDLSASNSGFTIGSATLAYAGAFSLGGVLSITGLSLGVEGFSYQAGTNGGAPTVGGTITFGAESVSLFAGQPAFSTTISDPSGKSLSGLTGSYDFSTEHFKLQLDEVDIKVSDLLEVTADDVALNVAPGSFSMTVGMAMASVPKLAGFQGSIQNLAITDDGFSIDTATLGFKGTISLGSVLTISNPSAMISGLSYSIGNRRNSTATLASVSRPA